MPMAETMDGECVRQATDVCAEHDCFTVFGMLEKSDGRLFNTTALVGPQGLMGSYRKVHLPYLGVDRFTTYGDRPFEVFEAAGVRIGMLICYDGSFPEASRILALKGADLILLPTNWPPGAETMAAHAINTRAMENGVYFLAVNRVGTERGFSFIGRSRFCDAAGKTISSAEHTECAVLRGTVNVQAARQKQVVRVPAGHVIDRLADRRPEVYGPVCESHKLPRPGRDVPV